MAFVQDVIAQAGRNLQDLTTDIQKARETMKEKDRLTFLDKSRQCLTKSPHQADNKRIKEDLGILVVADRCLSEFRESGCVMDEAWARLDWVSQLSSVNLRDKLKNEEVLTESEWNILWHWVLEVNRLGSHSVVLWKLVQAYQDLDLLKDIGALSDKQTEILKKHLNREGVEINVSRFNDLEPKVKKAFLDASNYFSRQFSGPNVERFEPMLQEEQIADDTLSIYSYDRSNNSSPRLEALNESGSQQADRTKKELEALYCTLGNVLDEQDQAMQNLHTSLGILRTKVISAWRNLSPDSDSYVNCLWEDVKELQSLDGSIAYLFKCFKETISVKELLNKQYISVGVLKEFITRIKAHPDFFYMLKKAGEVAALRPEFIAILAQAATQLSSDAKEALNEKFSIEDWIQIDRTPKYSLNPVANPRAAMDRSTSEIELSGPANSPAQSDEEEKHPD